MLTINCILSLSEYRFILSVASFIRWPDTHRPHRRVPLPIECLQSLNRLELLVISKIFTYAMLVDTLNRFWPNAGKNRHQLDHNRLAMHLFLVCVVLQPRTGHFSDKNEDSLAFLMCFIKCKLP